MTIYIVTAPTVILPHLHGQIQIYLETLFLPVLHQYANLHKENPKFDTKGVIMNPQLEVQPCDYIMPILHLMIGIVN